VQLSAPGATFTITVPMGASPSVFSGVILAAMAPRGGLGVSIVRTTLGGPGVQYQLTWRDYGNRDRFYVIATTAAGVIDANANAGAPTIVSATVQDVSVLVALLAAALTLHWQ
jgi:hypothetical protein